VSFCPFIYIKCEYSSSKRKLLYSDLESSTRDTRVTRAALFRSLVVMTSQLNETQNNDHCNYINISNAANVF